MATATPDLNPDAPEQRPFQDAPQKRDLWERVIRLLRDPGTRPDGLKAKEIAKGLREEKADVNRVLHHGRGMTREPFEKDPETFRFTA